MYKHLCRACDVSVNHVSSLTKTLHIVLGRGCIVRTLKKKGLVFFFFLKACTELGHTGGEVSMRVVAQAGEGRRGARNWDGRRTKATMGTGGWDRLSHSTRTQKADETKGL